MVWVFCTVTVIEKVVGEKDNVDKYVYIHAVKEKERAGEEREREREGGERKREGESASQRRKLILIFYV